MTNNEYLIALLREIKRMALSPPPNHDKADIDPNLTFALGSIAGMAVRAIVEHQGDDGENAR